MITIFFFVLMAVFTISDVSDRYIPNYVVLPAIIVGCYLTKNIVPALIMLLIGVALYGFKWKCPECGYVEEHKTPFSFWRGGDVKLITMTGAFMGILAIPIFIISVIGVFLYRHFKDSRGGLAYAPFLLISSLVTMGTTLLFNC